MDGLTCTIEIFNQIHIKLSLLFVNVMLSSIQSTKLDLNLPEFNYYFLFNYMIDFAFLYEVPVNMIFFINICLMLKSAYIIFNYEGIKQHI